jgi:hypothetical protein
MSAVLGTLIAVYVAMLLVLYVTQRQLLYVPDVQPPDLAAVGLAHVMGPVATRTDDGLDLLAWYRPPAANPAPVLVYLHGNAGHIGNRAERIRPYLEAGFGVFLVEYRGYGGNPGRPSEPGLYADARAALDYLREQGIGADRVVLYGESLGTGVAVQMAVERGCAALVLEAPFTSVAAVAQSRYWMFPVRPLVRDKFDSLAKIGRLRCPLFVMHGERDRVIPVRFGRELFAAAPEPKEGRWFPDGTHVDFDEHGAPAAVLRFLRRHRVVPAAA